MKKTILFLWGILSVLFFVSCSKEQLKPSEGSVPKLNTAQATLNGLTANPKPPCGGVGGSSIAQNPIAARTGLNGTAVITPPKPPGEKGSGIIKSAKHIHTGEDGDSIISPTTPKQP